MDTVLVMATNVTETETVELTGAALDARGVVCPTEVYATTDGRFALVRWVSDGSCRPRLIRVFPRAEAAAAANSALHGGNPVAEAKAKLAAKRRR